MEGAFYVHLMRHGLTASKLFLTSEEPLSPSSLPVRSSALLHTLQSSRQNYVKQLREYMRAPDGSYEEGFVLPVITLTPPARRTTSKDAVTNLETNNPLSLHTAVSLGVISPYPTTTSLTSESMESLVCSCRTEEDHFTGCRAHVSPSQWSSPRGSFKVF